MIAAGFDQHVFESSKPFKLIFIKLTEVYVSVVLLKTYLKPPHFIPFSLEGYPVHSRKNDQRKKDINKKVPSVWNIKIDKNSSESYWQKSHQ